MLKLMIVDNEAAIRGGLIHCIRWESLGCVVAAQAEDGIDALEQMEKVQPDLVISDIRMPGMDGLALAQRIRRDYPQTKTIILTGFPDFEYAKQAISCGVVDFVLKPTSVEDLTRAVEKAKAQLMEERSRQDIQQELADTSRHNLRLMREMLLQDLIQGIDLSVLYVCNRMAQLGVNLSGYYVLRMDVLAKDGGPVPEGEDCLGQVQDVVGGCLEEYAVYFVPRGEQMCYAVVAAGQTGGLAGLCTQAAEVLENLSGVHLCIGMSAYKTDPLLMAEAAGEADQAVQFASYAQEQPVVCFEDMPEITGETMERLLTHLKQLKTAIENQNQARTAQLIAGLFAEIRASKVPVDEVRNVCGYIHQFCAGILFAYSAQNGLEQAGLGAFQKRIHEGTMDEIEQSVMEFTGQVLARIGSQGEGPEGVAQTIRQYILQHYAEDISLESLAEQVYLSPSYLSKLFKRETGENISGYVQQVRIAKAKELMESTSLKTYEIAARVGIGDPVYFTRIFKKITGLKPKDYRQQRRLEAETQGT